MDKKNIICIVCPNSCRLEVVCTGKNVEVLGAGCKRGIEHGINEYTNPKRMLTTTVVICNGLYPRLSVVSDSEIAKEKIQQCLDYLYGIKVQAPVFCGDVIVKDICGTGVNIVASRTMICKK